MDMPAELKTITEKAAGNYQLHALRSVSKAMTRNYKENRGTESWLSEAAVFGAVYSVVRMPATFGAVYSALYHTMECFPMDGEYSLLDVGAGTGAGSIAVSMLSNLSSVICIERESEMRRFGEIYTGSCFGLKGKTVWKNGDIRSGINDSADIVLSSYVLNEMTESGRLSAVRDMWKRTKKLLLIVEPGTPQAFSQLMQIRDALLEEGAYIAAPCVHEKKCPLSDDDWCHFTVRVQRSKLHRLIKEADVPYEDEKFSYMAFVKEPLEHMGGRVLRHPQTEKGRISLTLCTDSGKTDTTVTKKDKNIYKSARKMESGDLFNAK